ncbi:MAG: ABC transporter substrate-binding protein [Bifidobacterium tibiigranuli]|jgi:polar amino acid transport system substrate-binding protein|uniref:substrate-binding periplasmic protein n=1 Tax=Bifidobacterium tibiigranuli TaxID=2172043 RepID=UPI0026EA1EA8|nr:ABC transporter substrate-binding protein [Bifidobacterium tibiigranuli]MCI1674306.1 ABC transporter substrate-binding protein [Bifidobacterium tibiigranuli]MCI1713414.1 ABC transporter substrate-binding protein [Bifidobacterium tibiigranuli]MCI1834102.1 ABC transporter substrate-binding protein [Bifidobacterium tibiigranuli]
MKHSRIVKGIALACAAIMSFGALSACGGSSSGSSSKSSITTVTSGKLTVGVIDIPPFSSYNSGNPKGIDVEIIKKIAKDNNLTPVWQQATYADAVQSISSGIIDVAIGDIDATAKRKQAVDFSSSTYLDGLGIAAKASKNVTTIADLEKLGTVGTVDGYLWVEDLRAILGSKLKTYPSSVELKADFDAGRLDAAIDAYGTQVPQFKGDSSVKVVLANEHPDKRVKATVQSPEAAFPFTKGNESLGKALDAGITSMHSDGTIKKLITGAGLSDGLAKVADKQYVVPLS